MKKRMLLLALLIVPMSAVFAGIKMDVIEDWLGSNWELLVGFIGLALSFILPGAKRIWPIMIQAFVTEKNLIRFVIWAGDNLVKSTRNNLDNTLWRPVRIRLFKELK